MSQQKSKLTAYLESSYPDHGLVLKALLGEALPPRDMIIVLSALADQLKGDVGGGAAAPVQMGARGMEVLLNEVREAEVSQCEDEVGSSLQELVKKVQELPDLVDDGAPRPETVLRSYMNQVNAVGTSGRSGEIPEVFEAERDVESWVLKVLRSQGSDSLSVRMASIQRLALYGLHQVKNKAFLSWET